MGRNIADFTFSDRDFFVGDVGCSLPREEDELFFVTFGGVLAAVRTGRKPDASGFHAATLRGTGDKTLVVLFGVQLDDECFSHLCPFEKSELFLVILVTK